MNARLGAEVFNRLEGPDGKIWNALLTVNGASIMLNDPMMGARSPKDLGGSAVSVHLIVEDVDAAVARAARAGAAIVIAPADMFWGDRYAIVEDPSGHRWAFATPVRSLSAAEVAQAARLAFEAHLAQTGVAP